MAFHRGNRLLVRALPSDFAKAAADEYPLSLQLQVLERDLTSQDYHDVLKTMISTDLAAEWQRVATPDNYHLFAKQHGGLEKVNGRSSRSNAAYDEAGADRRRSSSI